AVAAIQAQADLKPAKLTLHGERDSAVIALYAGIFEPSVAALDLWHLPDNHHDGPALLNVLRVLNVPYAVALAAPRKVTLHVPHVSHAHDASPWAVPLRLQSQAGGGSVVIKVVGE